jgi:hypothetical protein
MQNRIAHAQAAQRWPAKFHNGINGLRYHVAPVGGLIGQALVFVNGTPADISRHGPAVHASKIPEQLREQPLIKLRRSRD